MPSPASRNPAPAARRRARRGRRIAVGLLAAGVLAYVTLPAWLPIERLREQIVAELQRTLDGRITVGPVRVSWSGGIEIEDVRVSDGGAEREPLLAMARVALPFDPLSLALGRGPRWLQIDAPRLAALIDAQGRLRTISARPARGGRACELRLTDVRLHVSDERSGATAELALGDVHLSPPDAAGELTLDVHGRAGGRSGGLFASNAVFSPPPGAPSADSASAAAGQGLSGHGTITWDTLDLAALPLQLVPGWHGQSLRGNCSGSVTVSVSPQLEQAFAIALDLRDLAWTAPASAPAPAPAWQLATARLAARGVWQPTGDRIALEELTVALPGVELHGRPTAGPKSPVLELITAQAPRWRAGLSGHLVDLAAHRARLPASWVRWLFPSETAAATPLGPAPLDFDLNLAGGADEWRWDVNAFVRWPAAGTSTDAVERGRVALRGRGRLNRATSWLDLSEFTVVSADARLGGAASVPMPASLATAAADDVAAGAWLQDVWRRGTIRVEAEIPDAAWVESNLAGRVVAAPAHVQGPMTLTATMRPTDAGTRVELSLATRPGWTGALPGWLEVPAGSGLHAQLAATYRRDRDGWIDDLTTAVEIGTAGSSRSLPPRRRACGSPSAAPRRRRSAGQRLPRRFRSRSSRAALERRAVAGTLPARGRSAAPWRRARLDRQPDRRRRRATDRQRPACRLGRHDVGGALASRRCGRCRVARSPHSRAAGQARRSAGPRPARILVRPPSRAGPASVPRPRRGRRRRRHARPPDRRRPLELRRRSARRRRGPAAAHLSGAGDADRGCGAARRPAGPHRGHRRGRSVRMVCPGRCDEAGRAHRRADFGRRRVAG
ncbi:MAG: hypothetical protein U1A27_10510 [Phycisphaerae bacterium]